MPWMEASTVRLRQEFVALANQPDSNLSALCRRFRVSRKTAYKWMERCPADGLIADFRGRLRTHTFGR